jgi:signal transduction histidine kinase
MYRIIAWARTASATTQDTMLAAMLCLVDLLLFSDLTSRNGATDAAVVPRPLLVGYAVAGYATLRWRRRAPVVVFTTLWLHSMIALQLLVYRPTLGLLAALYTVAAYRDASTAVVALFATLVASGFMTAEELASDTHTDLRREVLIGNAIFYTIVDCGVYGVGRWAGRSRRHAADLERQQQVAAREAVATERARIARELHDIVSHAVTVMVLQASGARRVMLTDPARAEQAMVQVEALGRQAMGELRRLLGVLRTNDGADLEGPPQGGLADLEDLLTSVRSAGLSVRVEREGEPGRLDQSVDAAAYRVVQEALTNVTKHVGPGADILLRLRWADDLLLEVTDDGPEVTHSQLAALSTGHGLLGLRERVVLVGGRLAAAPVPQRGFRVTATLPLADHGVAAEDLPGR